MLNLPTRRIPSPRSAPSAPVSPLFSRLSGSRPAALLTVPLALAAAVLLAAAPATGAEADPALWPEGQRAFLQDGPGFLLSEVDRARLLALPDAAARTGFISDFLADPDPATSLNELAEGIERRRALAAAEYLSPRDVRARSLFLNGAPAERLIVECGVTFKPIEIWTYPGRPGDPAATAQQLVFYRPVAGAAWRLWYPLDSKRSLYTSEMEFVLQQAVGLRLRGPSYDRITCDESKKVDDATGIDGLRDFRDGRPLQSEIERYLEAPPDLAAWAHAAAATELPEPAARLGFDEVAFAFPERRNQRLVARAYLSLPAGAGLELDDEVGDPEVRLTVDVAIEQDGRIFEQFRTRFRHRLADASTPLVLAVDRALRPGRTYVARFRLTDEVGEGERRISVGFTVPDEPTPVEERELAVEVVEGLSVDLAHRAIAGADTLLLAPPPNAVLAGLWRAEALVTGERIEKVTFLVDGTPQATRSRPFSVEVRLAEVPRQQVVRAEGYDAAGELVAADEVVVNQPRGAFAVRIVEPARGFAGHGPVEVRAELVVPEGRRVEEVEVRLDDRPVKTLDRPPWTAVVDVPEPVGAEDEVTYISVVAKLDDGLTTEAVRFVNAPEYLQELDVRLVELYAAVVDGSGRPVTGLAADDFEVFEDGRRQEISKFELVEDLPLSIGVAIDVSGSMVKTLGRAQQAGRGFLAAVMRPGDRCFVLGFADQPELTMPPTDDAEACQRGLSDLRPYGATALHDAVATALYYFRGVSGQRALVLLSDGDDTASSISYPAVAEYARRNGVAIYAIGLEVSAIGLQIRSKLRQLAEETGGRVFFVGQAEELDSVYEEIEDELRNRYLIAYASDRTESGEGGDEFREVELKVKRRGLETRTIRGYYP